MQTLSSVNPPRDNYTCSGATASQIAFPLLDRIPKLIWDLHSNVLDVVCDSLTCLWALFLGSQDHQAEGYSLGAHQAILATMHKWQHSATIQWQGCRCLAAFCKANGNGMMALARLGALETGINAMILFKDSPNIPWSACQLFAALIRTTSGSKSKSTNMNDDDNLQCLVMADQCMHRFVHELCGVDLLVEAMDRFPNSVETQAGGCAVFACLSSEKELVGPLVKAGVARVVGAALENHNVSHAKEIMRNLFR